MILVLATIFREPSYILVLQESLQRVSGENVRRYSYMVAPTYGFDSFSPVLLRNSTVQVALNLSSFEDSLVGKAM